MKLYFVFILFEGVNIVLFVSVDYMMKLVLFVGVE